MVLQLLPFGVPTVALEHTSIPVSKTTNFVHVRGIVYLAFGMYLFSLAFHLILISLLHI